MRARGRERKGVGLASFARGMQPATPSRPQAREAPASSQEPMADLEIDTAHPVGRIWSSQPPQQLSTDGARFSLLCVQRERKAPSRVTAVAFNCRCDTLAILNEHGQLIVLELQHNRYNLLKRGGACGTCAVFSRTLASELFVGMADGSIECYDTEKRCMVGHLRGHHLKIRTLSCDNMRPLLLSCSADAIILWDSSDLSRVRQLALPRPSVGAVLLSDGERMAACFEHDVRLWRTDDFTLEAKLKLPVSHAKVRLRTLAVDESAALIAVGGDLGVVAVWSLREKTLLKLLQIPSGASIAGAAWIPSSNYLALVCDDGMLHLTVPSSEQVALSLLPSGSATRSGFSQVAFDTMGYSMAAVRTDGRVAVHYLEVLARLAGGAGVGQNGTTHAPARGAPLPHSTGLAKPKERRDPPRGRLASRVQRNRKPQKEFYRAPLFQGQVNLAQLLPLFQLGAVSEDSVLLDVQRLREMLWQAGRFPEKHRLLIWRFLLQLPNNECAHRGLTEKGLHPAHAGVHARTSLRDRRLSLRLERLLSCLAHWCPLFEEATDLDVAVFPWVLAFGPDDVAAFEAVATVLANWGQRFYECHPYPPVELLAGAASLLSHHAPVLAAHLEMLGVDASKWAWPLLQSCFSRSLGRDDWMVLWDHLLAHEPIFMLIALTAYAKLHAPVLLQARTVEQVCSVLHSESCLRVPLWMRTARAMLERTPDHFFPRWAPFLPLPAGPVYPRLVEFPRSVIGFGIAEVQRIKAHETELMQRRYLKASVRSVYEEAEAVAAAAEERHAQREAEAEAARNALVAKREQLQRLAYGGVAELGEAMTMAQANVQRAREAEATREAEHAQLMSKLAAEATAADAMAARFRGKAWWAGPGKPNGRRVGLPPASGEPAGLAPPSGQMADSLVSSVEQGQVASATAEAEFEQLNQALKASEAEQELKLAALRASQEAEASEARCRTAAITRGIEDRWHGAAVTQPIGLPEARFTIRSQIQSESSMEATELATDAGVPGRSSRRQSSSTTSSSQANAANGQCGCTTPQLGEWSDYGTWMARRYGAGPESAPAYPSQLPRDQMCQSKVDVIHSSPLTSACSQTPPVDAFGEDSIDLSESGRPSEAHHMDNGDELEAMLHRLQQQRLAHAQGLEERTDTELKTLLLQQGIATASTADSSAQHPVAKKSPEHSLGASTAYSSAQHPSANDSPEQSLEAHTFAPPYCSSSIPKSGAPPRECESELRAMTQAADIIAHFSPCNRSLPHSTARLGEGHCDGSLHTNTQCPFSTMSALFEDFAVSEVSCVEDSAGVGNSESAASLGDAVGDEAYKACAGVARRWEEEPIVLAGLEPRESIKIEPHSEPELDPPPMASPTGQMQPQSGSSREPIANVDSQRVDSDLAIDNKEARTLLDDLGSRLEGLGSNLRTRLDSEALAGRASADFLTPAVGSAAYGGTSDDTDPLGGLRLSGLQTGLREQLRGLAEEGRASGMGMHSPYATSSQQGDAISGRSNERPQVATSEADERPSFNSWGRDNHGIVDSETTPCATCELLSDQFESHDAWVESMRASAEAVMATHARAREALASLLPEGGDVPSSDEGGMA